jgi:L-ascorbate metabolism protein UlaG (beta-lactamase superfamily)
VLKLGLTLKFLGHAGFKINVDDKIIYIDPYHGECAELADFILVTHSHDDHCCVEDIEKTRKASTIVIAPQNCVSKIRGDVKVLKPGEKTVVKKIQVKATYAYNYKRFRSPGKPYHPKGLGVGYLITAQGKTIYHAGDTDFIPEMKQLKSIDVALLPSGGTYTMDNEEMAEAALAINPKVLIPMHRWDTDPMEVKKKVEATDPQIKVIVLRKGEQYIIK